MPVAWVVPKDVAWTGGEGRVVALHLSEITETPQAMEGPACSIWMAIAEGPVTVDDIATRLATEYATEPAELIPDIKAFLAQLTEQQLVATVEIA